MDTSSQIHRFRDEEEIRQLVRRFGFDVAYTRLSPGPLDVEAFEIHVDGCLVFRERIGCHLVAHGISSPHNFGVMVAETGTAHFFGNEVSPKTVILISPECQIDAVGRAGLSTVHYLLPRDRIVAAAMNSGIELIRAPRALVVEPGIDRLHHLQALLAKVTKILERGDVPSWPEVELGLVDTFLGLFDSTNFPQYCSQQSNKTSLEHALKVRSLVCSSPRDEPDLDSLARNLGIGRHHLARCFRQIYGVSIREFVHRCRLHEARNLLLDPSADLSVTEIAYSCGFSHLGRFSTEYKQLFGESPRQTLSAARA